jgi:SpoVK/Ycf46/Vps4 family AAA+-type ATPase
LINEFDDKVNGDVLLNLVNEFETANHPLLKEKLVEISHSELKERLIVKLIPTQKFYKEFLPELVNQFDRFKFLQIEKTDSAEFDEEFFYPEEIQKELALIEDLINSGVQKLTVFLSGDPGVGKTSFVKFLAKKLGKNLISNKSVKSKWFGESQSNLEEMFNQFQIVQKQLEIAPIFFIDEADSLLSKRVNPGENLSDTLNEMQGILLRKIENFRGIIICATNFPISRFDSAFERRFDIILEMKTNENAKMKMLESKKLNLSKDEIKELASNKKLTPAIIQLILKKKGLYESASLDFCFKNEVEKRLNTNISSNSIGFIK